MHLDAIISYKYVCRHLHFPWAILCENPSGFGAFVTLFMYLLSKYYTHVDILSGRTIGFWDWRCSQQYVIYLLALEWSLMKNVCSVVVPACNTWGVLISLIWRNVINRLVQVYFLGDIRSNCDFWKTGEFPKIICRQ